MEERNREESYETEENTRRKRNNLLMERDEEGMKKGERNGEK